MELVVQCERSADEKGEEEGDGGEARRASPFRETTNDKIEEKDGRQRQQPSQRIPVKIVNHATDDDESCHGITEGSKHPCQSFELKVQRCFHAVVDLCCDEDFSVFGVVADGFHFHDAVSFHHFCAFHDVV